MKPTSIISMVVAVLLIIAGFVTCLVAENMAEAEGQALFAENRDYGLVNTIDLAETAISKLAITVSDAQVNVYGGSETSYIELVNFRENYYSFSDSNRVVTFDEIPDVTSMLKFWENGMSFKGIRYLLTFNEEEPEGDKVINVYLGGDNIDLKIMNITGTNCEVHLDNLVYNTEYTFDLPGGSVIMNKCLNGTSMNLTGTDIVLDMTESSINTCNVHCSNLDFTGYRVMMPMTIIDCEVASMDLTPAQNLSTLNFDLTLEFGSISVSGSDVGTSFLQNASSNNRIVLTAVSGEVVLNDPPPMMWPPVTN